jgi:hypothetical protein
MMPSANLLLALSLLTQAPAPDLVQVQSEVHARLAYIRGRLTAVTGSMQQVTADFKKCKNGKLQLQFGPTLAKLEGGRKTFEASRRATERRRRELESRRSELEAAHRASLKHPGSGAEQTYQTQLAESYLRPLQKEVAGPLDAYVGGMTEYASVIARYAAFCAAPGYTPQAGAALVAELTPKADALVATAQHLALEAPATSLAQHVRSHAHRNPR